MVDNTIVVLKVQASFCAQLQYFHILSSDDCFALKKKFKLNNALDIAESEVHCASSLASWDVSCFDCTLCSLC